MHAPLRLRHPQALHPLAAAVLAAFCGTALAQNATPAKLPQTLGEVTVQSTTGDDGYSPAASTSAAMAARTMLRVPNTLFSTPSPGLASTMGTCL